MSGIKIDKIIRSRRRTIALVIMRDASLVIRAPYAVSVDYIQEIVNTKSEWIERKQKQFVLKAGELKPKNFISFF